MINKKFTFNKLFKTYIIFKKCVVVVINNAKFLLLKQEKYEYMTTT